MSPRARALPLRVGTVEGVLPPGEAAPRRPRTSAQSGRRAKGSRSNPEGARRVGRVGRLGGAGRSGVGAGGRPARSRQARLSGSVGSLGGSPAPTSSVAAGRREVGLRSDHLPGPAGARTRGRPALGMRRREGEGALRF